MATGRRAFAGESQASLIAAILDLEPEPISGDQPLTPPGLERLGTEVPGQGSRRSLAVREVPSRMNCGGSRPEAEAPPSLSRRQHRR